MPTGRDSFERMIAAPKPVFRCVPARFESGEPIVVEIEHIVGEPSSPRALGTIRGMLGRHGLDLFDFYADYDGANLFADEGAVHVGITLLPIRDWKRATAEMRDHFLRSRNSKRDSQCIATAIAFGEVPMSGNHLAMTVEGPSAGRIFYVTIETYPDAIADSFDQFLERMCADPPALLKSLGSYARYFKGLGIKPHVPVTYADSIADLETRSVEKT